MGYNFLTKEAAVPQIGREIDVTVTTSMFVPRIKREDRGATNSFVWHRSHLIRDDTGHLTGPGVNTEGEPH